jgi:hypothetical protein
MKKNRTANYAFIFLLLGTFFLMSCSDDKYDRDKGPSDIRIENVSSEIYDSILVNTSGGEHSYGSLNPGTQSDYKRFDFAYPEADISLYINSVKYTYGPVDYTYAVWLGKGKFTYKVGVESEVMHTLSIEVIADAPLD